MSSDLGDWRSGEWDYVDTSTDHSEHRSTTVRHREDENHEISAFSLLAAAVILAAIQCAFLCAH